MRIWDAAVPNYRLSLPFIARSVRIEPDRVPAGPPAVVRRFGFGTEALIEERRS